MSGNGALPVNYCPEHGDLLANGLREDDTRSDRCREAHTIAEIQASVRPHGTVTDAERQAVADAIDNTAVITPRNEFLGGSTIANILEVADAALEAVKEARW